MITVANIANASEIELVCITYELLLERLRAAIDAVEEMEEKRERGLAREVLLVLTENLSFESELATPLFNLYVYIQDRLINGREKKDLQIAYDLVKTIQDGYKELVTSQLAKQTGAMENAQDVYAGMTYGKGQLNEMVMQDSTRGFKA